MKKLQKQKACTNTWWMRLHAKMMWWSHDLNWDTCWDDAEVFGYKSITDESGDKHILPMLLPKSMLQKIKAFFLYLTIQATCLLRLHFGMEFLSLSFNGFCTFLVNMVGTRNLFPYWVLMQYISRLCDVSATLLPNGYVHVKLLSLVC